METFLSKLKFGSAGSVLCLLAVLAAVTYFPSMTNDFMIDDDGLILENKLGHHIRYLPYHLLPDLKPQLQLDGIETERYYRPTAHILPMIAYLMFRDFAPGYHIMNLLLFIGACFMIYLLVRKISHDGPLAAITSIFYALHPVNGLYVNYKTASVFSVQIIAMAGAIICAMNFSRDGRMKDGLLSLALLIVSLSCHETSMGLPIYFSVLVWLMFRGREKIQGLKINAAQYGIVAAFFWFRMTYASLNTSVLSQIDQFGISIWEYAASMAKILAYYASNLFLFKDIVLVWTMPPVRDNVLAYALTLSVTALLSMWVIFHPRVPKTVRLSLAWFFVGLLPVALAVFIDPAEGFLFEVHWVYFSSIGLFVIAAWFTRKIFEAHASAGIVVVTLMIFTLMGGSISYNRLWNNEKQYYRHWIRVIPDMGLPHFYYAFTLQEGGDYENARKEFIASLSGSAFDARAYNNLALMDMDEGRWESAREYFEMALALQPKQSTYHNNLGILHMKTGEWDTAVKKFHQANQLNPYLMQPRLNLALIAQSENRMEDAVRYCLDNLEIDPRHGETLLLLINLQLHEGQAEAAVNIGKDLLSSSNDPDLLLNAGLTFIQRNYESLALSLVEKSLMINPRNPSAYAALGKIYGNREKFNEAIAIWEEGVKNSGPNEELTDLIHQANQLRK